MHEGYSCEEFDAKYHAGLAKLWEALEVTHSDILVAHADVFEEAASQINAYHKLIAKMILRMANPLAGY